MTPKTKWTKPAKNHSRPAIRLLGPRPWRTSREQAHDNYNRSHSDSLRFCRFTPARRTRAGMARHAHGQVGHGHHGADPAQLRKLGLSFASQRSVLVPGARL